MNKKILLIIISISLAISLIVVFTYIKIDNDNQEKLDNFYLKGKYLVELKYNEEYVEKGFNANLDENQNYSNLVKIDSDLDASKVGTYHINYTLTYKNKYTKTLQRTIKIIDEDTPIITIDCKNDIYRSVNETFDTSMCNAKATDSYDGDITDKIVIDNKVDITKKGTYPITFKVTDSSGNESEKQINIHITNKFDHTYIKVNITKQRLYYYKYNEIIYETPVTTGAHGATKTGTFKIRNKVRNTTLKGKNYTSYVKYWMAYDGNKYGLHDASWRKKFGTMNYNTNGSHGCVNLPTEAAKIIYNMVEIGTPVIIYK